MPQSMDGHSTSLLQDHEEHLLPPQLINFDIAAERLISVQSEVEYIWK